MHWKKPWMSPTREKPHIAKTGGKWVVTNWMYLAMHANLYSVEGYRLHAASQYVATMNIREGTP